MLNQLLNILKLDEGLRLKPYTDTTGHTTIGYGRNLTDNGISIQEAETLLLNDVQNTISATEKNIHFYHDLSDTQKIALICLTFNLGIAGLLKFKRFLHHLEHGNYEASANALKFRIDGQPSLYYKQIGKRLDRICELLTQK